jgi:transporter family protein
MLWLIFSLLSSLATAIATVLTKQGLNYLDPIAITTLQTFSTSFVFILVAFYAKSSLAFYSSTTGTMIVIMSLLTNTLSYLFFAYALKHGPVIPVSAIYLLNLPLTLFICMVVLNEAMNIRLVIGTILMLVGSFILTV